MMKYINRTNKTIYLPSGDVFQPHEEKKLPKVIATIKGIDLVSPKKRTPKETTPSPKKAVKKGISKKKEVLPGTETSENIATTPNGS